MIELRRSLFKLDSLGDVQGALQAAVELEHATIPPYLYAVFSLMPLPGAGGDPNKPIRDLINTVIAEEMAHMALACNILNAIGGSPAIDTPGFVPDYPGPLPGGVEGGLTVGLEPFSIPVCKQMFMGIEEPEGKPVVGLFAKENLTIGAFYAEIKERLEPSMFGPDHGKQVSGPPAVSEVKPVHSLEDAQAAIDVIVEQGEGTSTSPLDHEGQYAHYYRFGEIANGHEIARVDPPTPSGNHWDYVGPPITLDTDAVVPLKPNPKRSDYSGNQPALDALDNFNYTYTTLLKSLHSTFNGRPGDLISAVGLMESLWEQALALATIELPDGTRAGPTFDYQPVNPAGGGTT
jgi:Ferritin-like